MMNNSDTPHLAWPLVGFALSLFIPSITVFQKYFGAASVAVYIVAASVALFASYRYILPGFTSRVTERQVFWLTAMTFLTLLVILLVVYPFANAGGILGGSDYDDSVNASTRELLSGRYPYYVTTYLGLPTVVLPGSLLIAIPFVLLGNTAYQNLFWLFAFFVATALYLKDTRLALLLLWAILVFSPIVLNNYVTGGYHLSHSLFVLLFIWFMVRSVPQPNLRCWRKLVSAVLLGLGLASHANFFLLLPLIFSFLVQNAGAKSAIKYTAIACTTTAVITIPFYLYDPLGFTPLLAANKLDQFRQVLPFAGIVIPLIGSIIALALSFQRMNEDLVILFRNCAIVQAFPVLCGAALSIIQAGRLATGFMFLHYGVFFLFFGALSFWIHLVKSANLAPLDARWRLNTP